MHHSQQILVFIPSQVHLVETALLCHLLGSYYRFDGNVSRSAQHLGISRNPLV
ncbi:hypothetical protein HQQ94_06860 [Shewanella sp. VB17]|uniref:hypothetical protein n=1 Tax=Shewanella sp. VB17 TaxID=2739432 RepID=UPI001564DED1|nr:hypothetical protein [Shewanella sp. VB17]NRD72962.1 hypothetical protein [Shewanella sp. VB17]